MRGSEVAPKFPLALQENCIPRVFSCFNFEVEIAFTCPASCGRCAGSGAIDACTLKPSRGVGDGKTGDEKQEAGVDEGEGPAIDGEGRNEERFAEVLKRTSKFTVTGALESEEAAFGRQRWGRLEDVFWSEEDVDGEDDALFWKEEAVKQEKGASSERRREEEDLHHANWE